jgi:hypothetical protein
MHQAMLVNSLHWGFPAPTEHNQDLTHNLCRLWSTQQEISSVIICLWDWQF